MARRDALIKLYGQLQARCHDLRRALSGDLAELHSDPGVRDDADAASDALTVEMSSQLAQIESRELAQIERALEKLRDGSYGVCENCARKIPVARLNALPYSTLCIECQRDLEAGSPFAERQESSWQKVFDRENAGREVRVDLAEMEYKLS